MPLIRRRPRPLPPSERVYPDIPWVDPAELDPPWWRRLLSGTGLAIMVVLLGIALAISIGVVLLVAFFLLDYLIS